MVAATIDKELDYYLKIIEKCKNKRGSREAVEIWKSKEMITLMKCLNRTKNKNLITNALILLTTLFEDIPPDLYNNAGVNINLIEGKDRDVLVSILSQEFLSN